MSGAISGSYTAEQGLFAHSSPVGLPHRISGHCCPNLCQEWSAEAAISHCHFPQGIKIPLGPKLFHGMGGVSGSSQRKQKGILLTQLLNTVLSLFQRCISVTGCSHILDRKIKDQKRVHEETGPVMKPRQWNYPILPLAMKIPVYNLLWVFWLKTACGLCVMHND